MSEFPESLEGLYWRQAFEVQYLESLAKQITGAPLFKLQTAADDRIAAIGETALSEYEDALDALTETEAGMQAFEHIRQGNAVVMELQSSVNTIGYLKASEQRFQQVEEGSKRSRPGSLCAIPCCCPVSEC